MERASVTQGSFLIAMRDYPEGLSFSDVIAAAQSQGGSYRTVDACIRRGWLVQRGPGGPWLLTYLGYLALHQVEVREWRRRLDAATHGHRKQEPGAKGETPL